MDEKRRHDREDVFTAIMISPNGHENRAPIYNISESGARIGLPLDFKRSIGAELRLFFPLDNEQTVMLNAHVVRVAVDHLGVEFGPAQEADIRYVMTEIGTVR